MKINPPTVVVLALLALGAGGVAYLALTATEELESGGPGEVRPVAVEVALPESGTIRDIRVLSGTLEASARLVVAAKTPGLLREITVDLDDEVTRGQAIGKIEDAQFVQAVAEARAELAVRNAELSRATTNIDLARVEYEREKQLRDDGVSTASQLDTALANLRAFEADLALTEARVDQAEASLELANIRLRDTVIRADWSGGQNTARVGERLQDAGNTLAVGSPVVTLVTLDPLLAVISVTERDYTRLAVGQEVTLTSDAVPGETFTGTVTRIAPVFRESSRQARVEIMVENPGERLRPGMFVRTRLVLQTRDAPTIIPSSAVTLRQNKQVVFVVDEATGTVRSVAVELGIREGDQVEVLSTENDRIDGPLVVLGQQLLEAGSPVNFDAPVRRVAKETEPKPAPTGSTGGGSALTPDELETGRPTQ